MTYFKNNWKDVAATPSDQFPALPFKEVIAKASGWDPEFVGAIVRAEDPSTSAITEKRFKSEEKAWEFISELEDSGFLITSYNCQQMYHTAGMPVDED